MNITTHSQTGSGADAGTADPNHRFASASPASIVAYVRDTAARPIISTNFRPLSIALVHLVNSIIPRIPILWVDHGYNTPETLAFVAEVQRAYDLNLQVYRPRIDAAVAGSADVPPLDTPEHARFTRRVKLEPFTRALSEWQPDYWITGIRADQTQYRRTLDVFSDGPQGTIRVAPFFHWTEVDVEGYIYNHDLPDYTHYVDPTKGPVERECGLQQLA